jgi:hypothetical protein
MHTLQGPAIKIVENQLGRTYAKLAPQMVVQMPMAQPGPGGALLPNGFPFGIPQIQPIRAPLADS